jgi:hypothetical protein
MTAKEIDKSVESAGTSISKEKLQEAIRKANVKSFAFLKETSSNVAFVKIPL